MVKTARDKKVEKIILSELKRLGEYKIEFISSGKMLALKFKPALTRGQLNHSLRRLDPVIKAKWQKAPKYACSRYTPSQLIERIRQEMRDVREGKRETVSTIKELNVGAETLYGFKLLMPKAERVEYNLLVRAQTYKKIRSQA